MSNIISYLINKENNAVCTQLIKQHKAKTCFYIKRDIHAIDRLMKG